MWRMSSIEVMIFIALVVVIVAVLLACQLRSGSAPWRLFSVLSREFVRSSVKAVKVSIPRSRHAPDQR